MDISIWPAKLGRSRRQACKVILWASGSVKHKGGKRNAWRSKPTAHAYVAGFGKGMLTSTPKWGSTKSNCRACVFSKSASKHTNASAHGKAVKPARKAAKGKPVLLRFDLQQKPNKLDLPSCIFSALWASENLRHAWPSKHPNKAPQRIAKGCWGEQPTRSKCSSCSTERHGKEGFCDAAASKADRLASRQTATTAGWSKGQGTIKLSDINFKPHRREDGTDEPLWAASAKNCERRTPVKSVPQSPWATDHCSNFSTARTEARQVLTAPLAPSSTSRKRRLTSLTSFNSASNSGNKPEDEPTRHAASMARSKTAVNALSSKLLAVNTAGLPETVVPEHKGSGHALEIRGPHLAHASAADWARVHAKANCDVACAEHWHFSAKACKRLREEKASANKTPLPMRSLNNNVCSSSQGSTPPNAQDKRGLRGKAAAIHNQKQNLSLSQTSWAKMATVVQNHDSLATSLKPSLQLT